MNWRRLPFLAPSARRARLVLLLFVLSAMGTQQLVAQTHWHVLPHSAAGVTAPAGDSGSNPDDGCVLCQIAAHAGSAAPPTLPWLFTASQNPVVYVASYHEADVPAVPAHAWQSRGPPAA